jgi:hypothetical protein
MAYVAAFPKSISKRFIIRVFIICRGNLGQRRNQQMGKLKIMAALRLKIEALFIIG